MQRLIWKEALAIAPIWVAATIAVGAAPVWSALQLAPFCLMAYVLGAVAIGAHAIGHEDAHRTLGSLLAQPERRSRILLIKLAVLSAAVLLLTAVAVLIPESPIRRFPTRSTLDSRVVYLPTLMGLTLAPCLALVARSTLGGTVFTIAVPGLLLAGSDLVGTQIFGAGAAGDIDRFKYTAFPIATVAACIAAAIAIWPAFARLEVPGDSGAHVALPSFGDAAAPSRRARSPYWLLAIKELHLQQITFIVAAIYVCGSAASFWTMRTGNNSLLAAWPGLNTLNAALVALLVGALASAEERQLGTLEWQALMPIAQWKQFAVKLAVVIGLTLGAGMVLPVVLAALSPTPRLTGFPPGAFWMLSVMCVAISIGSLYVSTLTSSGVRALATAFPVLMGTFMLLRLLQFALWTGWHRGWVPDPLIKWGQASETQAQWTTAGVMMGVAATFLYHAYRNHGVIEHSLRRIARQALSIGAAVVSAGIALFLLGLR